MQEDARSSLVRGATVPRRNDLLVVNQNKKDVASPKREQLSQSRERRNLIWKGIDF